MDRKERAMSILLRALMGKQYLSNCEWIIVLDPKSFQVAWVEDDGMNVICVIHAEDLRVFETGRD